MTNFLVLIVALVATMFVVVAGGTAVAAYLLGKELRLFLKAPSFYVRKMFGPPGPERQAKKIVSRIRGLLPAGSDLQRELHGRLKDAPRSLQDLSERRDRITLYLEYDVYGDGLGDAVGRQDPSAVRVLEARREEIDRRIEDALSQLKRVENRVAAHALATRHELEEGAMPEVLDETIDELDTLLLIEKEQGLLGE